MDYGEALNLGCGYYKKEGFINVDAYDCCEPDVVWDLNKFPWPWPDDSIDHIYAAHIFEHLEDWWRALKECGRILKLGGTLDLRVPDESSSSAGTYRDHNHIFTEHSFYGIKSTTDAAIGFRRHCNAWAETQYGTVPFILIGYVQVPWPQYFWMVKWCPKILRFCAEHMRNFIYEQRFMFQKIGEEHNKDDIL